MVCYETKILTDTETEAFYPRQFFPTPIPKFFVPRSNFPRPIPRLFSRYKIFRYRYFFNETKFFDTDTKTFSSRPNFQKNSMGLETETKTETFAYDRQLLGTSTENFQLLLATFSL